MAEWTKGVEVWKQGQSASATMLVVSQGGGPDVKQRDELKRATPSGATHTMALLTTSATIRLVGVAVKWFMPHAKILAPDQLDEAIAFLSVGESNANALKLEVERLVRELRSSRQSAK